MRYAWCHLKWRSAMFKMNKMHYKKFLFPRNLLFLKTVIKVTGVKVITFSFNKDLNKFCSK